MSAREDFLDGCQTIGASAVMAFSRGTMIVLAAAEPADEDLAAAIAAEHDAEMNARFAAQWATHVDGDGDIARFDLIEREAIMERRWALPDWPAEVLEVAASGAHFVAILPSGPGGEVRELDPGNLGGSIIVAVEPSEPVRRLLDLR